VSWERAKQLLHALDSCPFSDKQARLELIQRVLKAEPSPVPKGEGALREALESASQNRRRTISGTVHDGIRR